MLRSPWHPSTLLEHVDNPIGSASGAPRPDDTSSSAPPNPSTSTSSPPVAPYGPPSKGSMISFLAANLPRRSSRTCKGRLMRPPEHAIYALGWVACTIEPLEHVCQRPRCTKRKELGSMIEWGPVPLPWIPLHLCQGVALPNPKSPSLGLLDQGI